LPRIFVGGLSAYTPNIANTQARRLALIALTLTANRSSSHLENPALLFNTLRNFSLNLKQNATLQQRVRTRHHTQQARPDPHTLPTLHNNTRLNQPLQKYRNRYARSIHPASNI